MAEALDLAEIDEAVIDSLFDALHRQCEALARISEMKEGEEADARNRERLARTLSTLTRTLEKLKAIEAAHFERAARGAGGDTGGAAHADREGEAAREEIRRRLEKLRAAEEAARANRELDG